MITPTGERIALVSGGVRAEIGTVAAVLAGLSVDGVDLVEPLAADARPPFCSGIILSPWPNRVRAATWILDGSPQRLNVTEPSRGGALHGLLEFAEYEVRERSADAVTLGAVIPPQHGWPFLLDTTVTYALTADGVEVTHTATNLGPDRAPFATGSHPFLRIGAVPTADLELTVPAWSYFEVDARLDPIAERPVEGTRFDLRHGVRVGDLDLDTAFGGVEHRDGASAWLTAPDGARVTLRQDPDWRYLQVFTTDLFPSGDGVTRAVAVEPMTAPPDALNSGAGLVWLEPDTGWEGHWGLSYRAAS